MTIARLSHQGRLCLLLVMLTVTALWATGVAAADSGISITSPFSTTFAVGVDGAFTVTTTGDPPIAIGDGGASLPTGVSFVDNGDGTATLGGTPFSGDGGTYPITMTASNGADPNATQSFLLTVDEAPVITSADHATFVAGGAGSFSVTTTGTPDPTLSENGDLPSGLSLTDNHNGTATLGGIPGAGTGGTYPITITASNGTEPDASQTMTVTVLARPDLSIMVSPFTTSAPVGYQVQVGGSLGVATGTVSVSDGQGGTCVAALNGGRGSCAITEQASSSPYQIAALYGGDERYFTAQTTTSVMATVAVAGSAMTQTNGVSATAINGQDGVDTLTDSFYTADPVAAVSGGGPFFGVAVSPAAQFSSVLISDCNAVNPSTLLEWWNPVAAAWQPVAGDPGPQIGSKHSGCLSVALDGSTSSPTLAQLGTSAFTTVTYSGTARVPKWVGKASARCHVQKRCNVVIRNKGAPVASISATGALPPGLSLTAQGNGQALLAGTPATGSQGRFPLTLTAANGAGTARRSFVVTVKP